MTINSGGDNFPFTDHERDGENSTDATLFRHYSPTQLRWLSPDPYNGSYDLSDPQSLNRYAYLTNRPMSATDPMGLDCTYGGSGTTLTVNCGGSGDGPPGGSFNSGSSGTLWGLESGPVVSSGFTGGGALGGNYYSMPLAYGGTASNVTADSTEEASENPFTCASGNAQKVSLANGINHIPGVNTLNRWTGGASGFVVDALGGNTFSGATDLVQSIATGHSGSGEDAHSVFYNMGQGAVAGPTQGFGPAAQKVAMRFGKTIEGTPWASAPADVATNSIFGTVSKGLNAGGELTDLAGTTATAGLEAGEYATGVGELKLGYDALTYGGSLLGCWLGVLH